MGNALILSGGTGNRLGTEIPKQYIKVGGRPIISYCIEQLSCHERIDSIQIVAAQSWHQTILDCLEKYDIKRKFRGFSKPGETRQLSIYHGVEDIKRYTEDSDVVLIHDAARPLLSAQMITDCLSAVIGHDGVLPVLPMKDTVYQSVDGRKISALLNRSEILQGRHPNYLESVCIMKQTRDFIQNKSGQSMVQPSLLSWQEWILL